EVIDAHAAGDSHQVYAEVGRAIRKVWDAGEPARLEAGDERIRRNAIGILPECHVRDVEQPARLQIARLVVEQSPVELRRPFRSRPDFMDSVAAERQNAGFGRRVSQAVLLLAEAEVSDGDLVENVGCVTTASRLGSIGEPFELRNGRL